MAYPGHTYNARFVIYLIDDSVYANANAVQIVMPLKFANAARTGIALQRVNHSRHSLTYVARQSAQLFHRRSG